MQSSDDVEPEIDVSPVKKDSLVLNFVYSLARRKV